MAAPGRDELEAEHCWEADDRVPRRPAMTEFRQRSRLHQARWREAHHHPIGTQPIAPKPGDQRVRLVGSRIDLDHARATGANFVTPAALDAAQRRVAVVERHQTFDHQRLWADLLWSSTFAFNLFGDLAADPAAADRAAHAWFPDMPGTVDEVRFAHSPGRWDPAYLNSLRTFGAALVAHRRDASGSILAFGVRYHERNHPEQPRPENLARYREVAERSGAFAPAAIDGLLRRSDLCELWLEHLLLLSMLQHVDGTWTWGRFVLVHPAGNVDIAGQCSRYRELLVDEATFTTMTLEDLLGSGALPAPAAAALRARYALVEP